MARKIILLVILFSQSAWASEMRVKEGDRTATLKQTKDYWISIDCRKCEAQKVMETTGPEAIKAALVKVSDGRISPGTRLCNGLGGMSWSLKDHEDKTHSICEFKDKSYVLTDDLAGLINKN